MLRRGAHSPTAPPHKLLLCADISVWGPGMVVLAHNGRCLEWSLGGGACTGEGGRHPWRIQAITCINNVDPRGNMH